MKRFRQQERQRGNPLRAVVWGTAALLLLLPLIAKQFTSEVDWGAEDFMVFGAMLLIACGSYELATRVSGDKAYRLAAGLALLGSFLLVWMNLAVGIIGNESHPANLMFLAMPVVGLVGAFSAQWASRGMARALLATACAQALVALIARWAGWGDPTILFGLTGFFVVLWLTSAGLFYTAAREAGPGKPR